MHLFDTSDPGVVAARTKFYITLIILAVATYAAAGLAYWLVRNRKQDQPVEAEVEERVRGKGFNEDGNLNNVTNEYEKKGRFIRMKWKGGGFGFFRGRKDRPLQEQSASDTIA
jgi:hypothetical protein